MDIWFNIAVAFGCLVYGFLLGSIPTGVIIGKLFFGKDPRNFGSHNSGGTNAGRVFGRNIGVLVMTLDIAKSMLSFWTVWAFIRFGPIDSATLWDNGVFYIYLSQIAAAFGHCFSPWLGFRGGKAVACFMGIVSGVSWLGLIYSVIAFFITFYAFKRVMSKASILSSAIIVAITGGLALTRILTQQYGAFSMLMWDFGVGGVYLGWEIVFAQIVVYSLLVIRHSANIKRIRSGEEKSLEW